MDKSFNLTVEGKPGAFKFELGESYFGPYVNVASSDDSEDVRVWTISMASLPESKDLKEGEFYLKNYSENYDIAPKLVEDGLIEQVESYPPFKLPGTPVPLIVSVYRISERGQEYTTTEPDWDKVYKEYEEALWKKQWEPRSANTRREWAGSPPNPKDYGFDLKLQHLEWEFMESDYSKNPPEGWERMNSFAEWRQQEQGNTIAKFGQWKVTDKGMVCEQTSYFIGTYQLLKDNPPDSVRTWKQHMFEKGWVHREQLEEALAYARWYHTFKPFNKPKIVEDDW